ncbi:MAG TPA: lipopolysaccharide heptosyltransferase II [Acidobacteriota bacterium]|nr:lipopolysaccharide heptosyltransferase II [Acidobacteriota bacterium]
MIRNILIRAPNHLGDCIMAMPMINEAREAYPGSTVTVLAPEHLVELYTGNPAVDGTLSIPLRHVHGLIGVVKIKEIIAPGKFDIGFILPPSFGAASAFKLVGIRERIGYIADGRRLLLTRPLPLPAPLNSEHRSRVYFNLLRRASGVELEYVQPRLFLAETDVQAGERLLAGFDVAPDDDYVAIAFRAVAESRRWGIDRYTELILELLNRSRLKVVLVGSSDDRKAGDDIVEAVDRSRVVNLAGKTSLTELAAVFARADLLIGNDSGPAHLAAAVGSPLVVLSGADDPKETSPISDRKRLIYRDNLACISCVKNRCPNKGDDFMRCMKEITVDAVLGKVDEILREV